MSVAIEPWDGQYASACRIHDLAEASMPFGQRLDRSKAIEFINLRTKGYEDSAFVAKADGEIQGFGMLSAGATPLEVYLMGCVREAYRCQGIATTLLERLMERAKHHRVQTIRGTAFESVPSGSAFLKTNGFVMADAQYWSARATSLPLPDWALEKYEQVLATGLRIVPGDQYERLRDDWDRAWWTLVNLTARDIPSRVPHKDIPFDEWRTFMEQPITNRAHTLLALDELEPIAVMGFGQLTDGKVNINYTGVRSDYRRRGISMALKVLGVRLAKDIGAHTITTQNHQDNPMFTLNQKLGFNHTNTMTEYALNLTVS